MARTTNQKLAQKVTLHRQYAVAAERGVVRDLAKMLKGVRQEVIDKLARAASSRRLTKPEIDKLVMDIRISMAGSKDEMTEALGDRLAALHAWEVESTLEVFRASLPLGVARDVTAPVQMGVRKLEEQILSPPVHGVTYAQAIERMFDRLGNAVSGEAQKAFGDAFRSALASGESLARSRDIAFQTAANLEKSITGVQEAFKRTVTRDLQVIVHGHTMATLDRAQTQVYQKNRRLLQGVTFSATLDMLTCEVCASLDGTMYWMDEVPEDEEGELFEAKPEMPVHPNCRCCYVPVVKSWRDLGVSDEDMPEGSKLLTRGDIPRPQKYEDWFNNLAGATQKDILGPGRYDLWKSGAVGLKDMAAMDRALTLDELRGLSALAETPEPVASRYVPAAHGADLEGEWSFARSAEWADTLVAMGDSGVLEGLVDKNGDYTGPGTVLRSGNPAGDQVLGRIYERQGFDALPEMVPPEQLDKLVKDEGYRELYRGITEQRFCWEFQTGEHFPGKGIYGNGTYTVEPVAPFGTEARQSAEMWAAKTARSYADDVQGGTLRMALRPEAKVIDVRELAKRLNDVGNHMLIQGQDALMRGDKEQALKMFRLQRAILGDNGRAAAALGYDAITVRQSEGNYTVVLNRSAVVADERVYNPRELVEEKEAVYYGHNKPLQ